MDKLVMKYKAGRPSKYKNNESLVVRKLSEAFQNDFTVEEACAYAGISKDTYYRWLKENKEFSDEMEASKNFATIAAKKVVMTAIQKGNLKAAQWFLERRQKETYGTKPTAYQFQPPEEPTPEEWAEIEAILDENL